ncbi:quinol dehydrogenase ferredoxin subunit NapH [Curvibacter sp. APW13]|uniref:quinol dehydrogenase ferredoxin subunit NapH n=1 Tax=Curvibacter sp. APW13 TaxID=3077236 RepID=UPI0028DE43EF|nr:quinol dehydrogenase ferredoxin subunit NapH [Curvibacter sp. APW13]MDT8990768.1 quinol dehydrogenase ferredoxin subunit NapH [Curvibacter sp. APW13]
MSRATLPVGFDALQAKGWWGAHRWLLLRRASQLGVLGLFLVGPWFGWWLVKGNLSYSYTLNTLPLTDPLLLLQVLVTRHTPERNAVIGALIVLAFYALVGGRVFCAWVCPINPVTDAASYLRRQLDIRGGADMPRSARLWMLGLILVLAASTGTIVWELVNPVPMLHRGLIFGMGMGWLLILAIFLFDLFVMKRGWCGHLCPVGAFYGLLGRKSLVRISATQREACNDCLDCFAVCPEQHVIKLPLKGAPKGIGPVIAAGDCSNCARCIDVCAKNVFAFTLTDAKPAADKPLQS